MNTKRNSKKYLSVNRIITPIILISPFSAWEKVNFNPYHLNNSDLAEWKNPDNFILQLFKDYKAGNEATESRLEHLFPDLFLEPSVSITFSH